jgi:hypothetical protein
MPLIGHKPQGWKAGVALPDTIEQMPVAWCAMTHKATDIFELGRLSALINVAKRCISEGGAALR